MSNRISLLALAVLLALGAGYLTLGPSVVLGGPTKATIVEVTRAVMLASAASPEQDAAAQAAEITPQGLCSRNQDGSHACLVEITTPGAAPRSLISVLRKDAGGGWIPAQ
jgi:hypothetical protein